MPRTFALIWNSDLRIIDFSVRYERYVEGLHANGYDTVTVCPAGTEVGYLHPTRTFYDEAEICQPQFWSDLGCCGVAMLTWHRMTNILQALTASNTPVLALTDSDGQVSLRRFPWPTLRFMLFCQSGVFNRIASLKHWTLRFLLAAKGEHQALLENTAAATVTTFAAEGALVEFQKLLQSLRATSLIERLAWLPYPVREEFSTATMNPTRRTDRIIAIGRWQVGQKNAALLAKTVEKVAKLRPQTEFLIVGSFTDCFADLAHRVPSVRLMGVQTPVAIREMMATCPVLIVPSRWESGPIVAHEMLALGGTVVGTPIPTLAGLVKDQRFGRISRSHQAASLAEAAIAELDAWDRGERDALQIASHWRKLVSTKAVAARMLTLLSLPILAERTASGQQIELFNG